MGIAATHVPLPSHVEAGVAWPGEQVAGVHSEPAANRWHAPAPLHTPVVPHEDTGVVGQSSSGSVSILTASQEPSMPNPFLAAEHATQGPSQSASQQRPSMQKSLAHSAALAHVKPFRLAPNK